MGGQKAIALFYQHVAPLVPVTIVSTRNNEVPPGTPYGFLPLLPDSITRYINPFLYFKLNRLFRKNGTTHLLMEHPYFGWLGILLKKTTGVKLMVHSHNIEALRFKSTGRWWWRILWHYEKFVHRQADTSFFITEEDQDFAIAKFRLKPQSCHVATYGTVRSEPPSKEQKHTAEKALRLRHSIPQTARILLFNGTLDYQPNTAAVDDILQHINPILMADPAFDYRIIICGKNLPERYNQLKAFEKNNILYAGFVHDIDEYFYGADIFINPVNSGGGIKTKLVEALAAGVSCVSSITGATGVTPSVAGKKLSVVEDTDWNAFAKAIMDSDPDTETKPAFFEHFYWGNIAAKAAAVIRAEK